MNATRPVPTSVTVRLSQASTREFWQQTEHLRDRRKFTWRWLADEMNKRGYVGATGQWLSNRAYFTRTGYNVTIDLADAILIADILGHHVPALDEALASLGDGVAMLLGHPPTGDEPS